MLQNHARKLGVSVDSLSFEFRVQEEPGLTDDILNDVKQAVSIKDKGFKVTENELFCICFLTPML